MASNLSSVPPVCPKPRPEIIGTRSPQAAKIGATMNDVASPTPPVECLSATTGPAPHSSTRPLSRIAQVNAVRKAGESGRKSTAIAKLAICASVNAPCPI